MRNLTWGALLVVSCLGTTPAVAQSSFPPYVVQGPSIILSQLNVPGCRLKNENFGTGDLTKCVIISHDMSQGTSASIALKRYILVPTGNLMFEFPVVSDVVGSNTTVDFGVSVNTVGPNSQGKEETVSGTGGVEFRNPTGVSSAVVQVATPVDWAESVTTFSLSVDVRECPASHDPEHPCFVGKGGGAGPDLSSISLNSIYPTGLPGDAFLIIATPAAGFQLPVLPTTILYAPLGNASNAQSSFTVTNIVGTNQQFTNSVDQTQGFTSDDKNQYQLGVTLSLSGQGEHDDIVCGTGTTCKLGLGVNKSESWENSTETDNEET